MYGAILGDIIGSPYEFCERVKTKDFNLFDRYSVFTDDTVMTVAVAQALMKSGKEADLDTIRKNVIDVMQHFGNLYPKAGYGGMFRKWLKDKNPKPYGSYGNGSAMRVSAVGWLYDSLERTREVAKATAEVTHNHEEGVKGAEAVASCIFLARYSFGKSEIKDYIEKEFGYNLSRPFRDIRTNYKSAVSCQGTVPEAIAAFLDSNNFEDAIRNAVSLGGDTDTLAAITGSIAEAYYSIPKDLVKECEEYLTDDLKMVIHKFLAECKKKPAFSDKMKEVKNEIEDFHYKGIFVKDNDAYLPKEKDGRLYLDFCENPSGILLSETEKIQELLKEYPGLDTGIITKGVYSLDIIKDIDIHKDGEMIFYQEYGSNKFDIPVMYVDSIPNANLNYCVGENSDLLCKHCDGVMLQEYLERPVGLGTESLKGFGYRWMHLNHRVSRNMIHVMKKLMGVLHLKNVYGTYLMKMSVYNGKGNHPQNVGIDELTGMSKSLGATNPVDYAFENIFLKELRIVNPKLIFAKKEVCEYLNQKKAECEDLKDCKIVEIKTYLKDLDFIDENYSVMMEVVDDLEKMQVYEKDIAWMIKRTIENHFEDTFDIE